MSKRLVGSLPQGAKETVSVKEDVELKSQYLVHVTVLGEDDI